MGQYQPRAAVEGAIMRQIGFAMMVAGSLLAAGTLVSSPAAAMSAGATPAGLQLAASEIETVLKTSCVRQGWHGLGNYPTCERPVKKKRLKARRTQ